MKNLLFKSIQLLLLISTVLFLSCEEEELKVTPVDLRFDSESEYSISAASPEKISFDVRSTDDWSVYSSNAEWCEISPASGVADVLATVAVQYEDNTELDDRIDILVIKSDYWIGTEVTVTQKGTAFLTIDEDEFMLKLLEDNAVCNVKANQKWSAEVISGDPWLTITAGAKGELDGSITFQAEENKGEIRYGIISVKDRHGVEQAKIDVTQNGVQLDPEALELRVLYDGKRVELPVISNAKWVATKSDEEIDWYSFESAENNGNTTLVIILDDNLTPEVRQAIFSLKTELIEGVESVERTITLKQAFNNVPVRYEFDDSERSKWNVNRGRPTFEGGDVTFTGDERLTRTLHAGKYEFRVKSMTTSAYSLIYFTYAKTEFRWHLNALEGKTGYSTSPYLSYIQENQVVFDPSVPHTLTLDLSEAGDGFTKVRWYLDGVLTATLETTKIFEKTEGLAKVAWPSNSDVILGGESGGTVVFDYYDYTQPILW